MYLSSNQAANILAVALVLFPLISCMKGEDSTEVSRDSESRSVAQPGSEDVKEADEVTNYQSYVDKMEKKIQRVNGFSHIRLSVESSDREAAIIINGDLRDRDDLLWLVSYVSSYEAPTKNGIWVGSFQGEQENNRIPFTIGSSEEEKGSEKKGSDPID